MSLPRTVLALVLPLALLVGCGDRTSTATDGPTSLSTSQTTSRATHSPSPSHSPSATHTPPHPGAPQCSSVWKAGHRISRTYTGCNTSTEYVARGGFSCSSGQRMVTYDSHYWGVLGGTVKQTSRTLVKDHRYLHDVHVCRA